MKKALIVLLLALILVSTVSAVTLRLNSSYTSHSYRTTDGNWEAIHDGTGYSCQPSPTTVIYAGRLYSGFVGVEDPSIPIYTANYRGRATFPTSLIPDDGSISSATLTFYYSSKNGELGSANMSIVDAEPVSLTACSASDYQNTNYVRQTPDFGYDNFTTGWNTISFYEDIENTINKTSNQSFSFLTEWDADNIEPEEYVEDSVSGFLIYSEKYGYLDVPANRGKRAPYLTIIYELSVPDSNFAADVTTGRGLPDPLTVTFTDTTLNAPLTWSWSYQLNGTPGWTVFSTDQNPTFDFPAGTYDVNLTTTNNQGSNDEIKYSYINSVPGYPTSIITTNTTHALAPLSIEFTDSSLVIDMISREWDFGDGTNTTDANPIHTYPTIGTYTVSLNITNATASDVSTLRVISEVQHPVLVNISAAAGRVTPNSAANSSYADILAIANGGLTRNFTTLSLTSDYWGTNLKAMPFIYQATGDTRYANKTVEALVIFFQRGGSSYSSTTWAYDLIRETMGVNSTLDEANNTYIRDNIAIAADKGHQKVTHYKSYTGNCVVDDYNMNAYLGLAPTGLVLEDYSNDSLTYGTTPADWLDLGTDALFVNDIHHRAGLNGLMACAYDVNSGKGVLDEGYTQYYEDSMIRWFNRYYTARGHNILEDYPNWTNANPVIDDVWADLPNGYSDNIHASSVYGNLNNEYAWGILDDYNESISRWHIALLKKNIARNLIPSSRTGTTFSNFWYDYDTYMYYYPYTTLTIHPPTNLNTLTGIQNVIRGSWDEDSEWLKMVMWDTTTLPTGQSRNSAGNPDQLGIQYYSHGDFLIMEQSDLKYLEPNQDTYEGMQQSNNLRIGIPSDPMVRTSYPFRSLHNGHMVYQTSRGSNLTTRYYPKASVYGTTTPANKTVAFDNAFMTIKGGEVNITQVTRECGSAGTSCSKADPTTFPQPIDYTRTILFPKDYMIVVDRAESSINYDYVIPNLVSSLNITRSQPITAPWVGGWIGSCGPIEPDGDYAGQIYVHRICENKTGRVNGDMFVDGVNYDWYNVSGKMFENYQSGNINQIDWNTVNPYGDPVNFTIFTSPETNTSVMKLGIRIGTDSYYPNDQGVFYDVYAPWVFFNNYNVPYLYRVTALLTKYSNETARIPSELTVTGTGSATKIIAADSSYTDYIYTGTGTSTFDILNTDAETVFVRNNTTAITHYTLINGTFLKNGGLNKFESNTTVSIDWNVPTLSRSKFNVSGTGDALLSFYNETTPSTVRKDGVDLLEAGNWTMNGTTFELTTSLSDHYFEYGDIIAPVTDFTADSVTGSTPFTVHFTDTSLNSPTEWNWTFGASNYSEERNPSYIFAGEGLYTVALNASNEDGFDVETKVDYINVTAAPLYPTADFTSNETTGDSPLAINFTDLSTNTPTSWYWEFGDGNTSTDQHPENTYYTPGYYDVNMSATNADGTDWHNITGYILVSEVPEEDTPPIANFTVSKTTIVFPGRISVIDTSTNSTDVVWDWGDGTDPDFNASTTHQYTKRGVWNMSLYTENGGGNSTKYQEIRVIGYQGMIMDMLGIPNEGV